MGRSQKVGLSAVSFLGRFENLNNPKKDAAPIPNANKIRFHNTI